MRFSKAILCAVALMVSCPVTVAAQEAPPADIAFGGTHPPDPAAIAVAMEYAATEQGFDSVAERDEGRAPLVSPGYFYHGLDGHPIDFEGMAARQTANGLEESSVNEYFDVAFYQYEHTALVTYKIWNVRMDMGRERAMLGSGLMVLTQTEDGWQVAADFLGREPSDEHVPENILQMRDAYFTETEAAE